MLIYKYFLKQIIKTMLFLINENYKNHLKIGILPQKTSNRYVAVFLN